MNDALGPRAKAFLKSVRDGDDPTHADWNRVHAKLQERLAIGFGACATAEIAVKEAGAVARASVSVASAGPSGAGASFLAKIGPAVVAAAMATGATAAVVRLTERPDIVAVGERPSSADTPAMGEGRAMSAEPASPTTIGDDERPREIGAPAAPRAPIVARATTRAPVVSASSLPARAPVTIASSGSAGASTPEIQRSPLDAEIALLRDARAALRRGDAAGALVLIDAHDRRFPDGALDEDCSAERIYALCALGRVDEARALAAEFVAAHPVSPHAALVRSSCGIAVGK